MARNAFQSRQLDFSLEAEIQLPRLKPFSLPSRLTQWWLATWNNFVMHIVITELLLGELGKNLFGSMKPIH